MKTFGRLRLSDVFLLPIAGYALGGAVIVLLCPSLMKTPWREILIHSLLVSPALALLAAWTVIKGEKSLSIILSATAGTLGTICWIYIFWQKLKA